ncbi:hypothetical protein ACFOSV_11890 [Algoriphagus namhaensis]|uniref:N-acetyltransferase domain-containing protein n=1 Tax=Algoriphagus namhaensis TaxID=915353 RepID=A0ABV8ASB5_9BACT
MQSLFNKIKPVHVDQFVYFHEKVDADLLETDTYLPFPVSEKSKDVFSFFDGSELAHKSKVFHHSRLLKSFGFKSPMVCIGDCVTFPEYRGKGLYPAMLTYLKNRFSPFSQIFILVSPQNKPSIIGIEKAGFKRIARIKCLKIGPIYLDKRKEELDTL